MPVVHRSKFAMSDAFVLVAAVVPQGLNVDVCTIQRVLIY